jgi:hypothetical protein
MINNDTFSGGGKKGEEELLDFDFDASSGGDVGNENSDFSTDEEILELVDIAEPAADSDDSESDEIAELLKEEPFEEPEEEISREEDTSQILESDIGSVLDEMESPEGEVDEGERFFDDSETDEIAKLLEEEPVEEREEKVLEEEDTSQILESDIGAVFDEMEAPEGGIDQGEKFFDDSETDEIAKLLGEEPVEEGLEAEEEEELDLEELEQIPEEDATQAFEADLDTTIASMEPAEELDTALQLDESELESIYNDESLGVAKVESEELEGFEESREVPVGDEETSELGEETQPEIPYEDLSLVPETGEEALEEDMFSHAGQEVIGISEERIESIIREVVEDVVERVAKETMVTVAEKVIKSAIDALKESIESSRD